MAQDEYGVELQEISVQFLRAGFQPSVRGEAKDRFVYVELQNRAAKISQDNTGWFIELFEQPNEVSVRDELQDTIAIAVEVTIDWLRRH